MRTLTAATLVALALMLLASASSVSAQTVTPVASQLLPCRAGAGDFNSCGGLCAVGSHCVFDSRSATNACACVVDALVCGVGTQAEQGLCPGIPNTPDGDCQQIGSGVTGYRCR